MENEYTKVMSERSDEALIKIITVDKEKYNPTAIEAANSEIEKRNIKTSEFEQIQTQATNQKVQEQNVSANVVSSGIRFVNFLIDFVVCSILIVSVSFIAGLFIQATEENTLTIISYILILGTYIAYYSIMEIKFQKTIGKFITKTKVVKLNGEKPEDGEIYTRTFCRLIPFDRISFLFTKNGFHDFLSKTKVIKDTAE